MDSFIKNQALLLNLYCILKSYYKIKRMKIHSLLLIVLAFVCSLNCSSETIDEPTTISTNTSSLYFPPTDSNTWDTISIESLNWNTNNLETLLQFIDEKNTKAFIILKDGKIALEWYGNGANENSNLPWNSAGKTLSAFTIGIAQQQNLLNINTSSLNYLGENWADLTTTEAENITVKQHLTMTTGLDYTVENSNCYESECLTFLNEPDTFWYYHNAPYTLTQGIVEGATNMDFKDYFNLQLRDRIGMQGNWISIGYSNVFFSSARSMARFGLLNLNKGTWDTTSILNDLNYFNDMTSTSQTLNKAYGYLWWLNGKDSFRSPGTTLEFPGKLIPNAPDDLYAGLGKNDQKLYVVPSENMVVIRMGDSADAVLLGPSSFDNELWEHINLVIN